MWELIETGCVVITMLGGAGAIIISIINWFRKPDLTRDEKLKRHDELLDNDNKRLRELEKKQAEFEQSQKLTMRGLYALMRHAIDGNNIDQLTKESELLSDYIFNK